jgi:hypothetical protein
MNVIFSPNHRTSMQLTIQEMKLFEQLRKEEHRWPRQRWFFLGTGIFAALCATVMVILVLNRVGIMLSDHDEVFARAWLLLFAAFWPNCLILFGVAFFVIFRAIRDWHGNANRMLLLKLLEAQKMGEA